MDHLQRHTHTESFRYLAETQATLRAIALHPSPKILVFGCSIGDEVLPLAAARPDAKILAVDINADALSAATTLLAPFANVTVALSDWGTVADFGPFDAVLANSVLCRHPEGLATTQLDELPFAKWDELVSSLIENLGVGGVLQVVNSNYRIMSSTAADQVVAMPLPGVQHSGFVPRFHRSGQKAIHIERRRLDDGLNFWLAPGDTVDLGAELAPSLFCRSGAGSIETVSGRVGLPYRDLAMLGVVSERSHQPDTEGPDGFVACRVTRRFSAAGRAGVPEFFADELLVDDISIGTRLTPLSTPSVDD